MTDERELLRACFEGEKEAWDELVVQYSRLVYSTIRQTLRRHYFDLNQSVVEELFQDFFLSLLREEFKKLRQFRGERGCSLASWLRVVATRLTIDFLRRQKNREPFENEPPPVGPMDLATELIHKEKEKFLTDLIKVLPAGDRLLIELCFKQELPAEDVAVILGTSVNAVYTRKSRVLARLREAIKQADLL